MTSLPKVPAMDPDLKGAAMRGPERSQLTSAEDSKIHLVLELVDRLEARWEADSLIAPLRARREITASGRLLVRRDGIVPLAVEIVTRDVDRLHLSFSDLEAFGV